MNFFILLSGMAPFNREVGFQISLLRTYCTTWNRGKCALVHSALMEALSGIKGLSAHTEHKQTNKKKTELLLEKEKQCIVGQNRDQSNPIKATHTTAITRNICRIF